MTIEEEGKKKSGFSFGLFKKSSTVKKVKSPIDKEE
jgi:hypothetical protein